METRITATELARSLSDILNRVRYRGVSFLIERNGEAVARLSPATPAKEVTWEQFIKLLQELPEPDEDYFKELEELRAFQPSLPPPPEWPS